MTNEATPYRAGWNYFRERERLAVYVHPTYIKICLVNQFQDSFIIYITDDKECCVASYLENHKSDCFFRAEENVTFCSIGFWPLPEYSKSSETDFNSSQS